MNVAQLVVDQSTCMTKFSTASDDLEISLWARSDRSRNLYISTYDFTTLLSSETAPFQVIS